MALSQDAKLLLSKHPELVKEVLLGFKDSLGTSDVLSEDIDYFLKENTDTKRDWEILSFTAKVGAGEVVLTKNEGGLYGWYLDRNVSKEECLKIGFDIHSVKRVSDGDVFTVGDDTDKGKIERFTILSDGVTILSEFVSAGCVSYNLNHLQKAKPYLFTIDDGKPVYEGDEFFYVPDDLSMIEPHIAKIKMVPFGKAFSTKQLASDHILMNKPCISVADIQRLFFGMGWTPFTEVVAECIELAKTKLH